MPLDATDREVIREIVKEGQSADRWTGRITAICAGLAMILGGVNHQKLDTVDEKQAVVVQKAAEVKKELEDTNETLLNGNYVYQARQLEEAINDGLPSAEIKIRRDRMKEAKKVYDEYVAKKREKS